MGIVDKLDLVYYIEHLLNHEELKPYFLNVLKSNDYMVKFLYDYDDIVSNGIYSYNNVLIIKTDKMKDDNLPNRLFYPVRRSMNKFLPHTKMLQSVLENMREKNIKDYKHIRVYRRQSGNNKDRFNFKVTLDWANELKVYNMIYDI